ncbi:MAG: hypothetical protein HY717_14205 [Planctomycetes bacterium]|nr:hypothetical protein [Planctomycetota bacterium]
MPKYRIISGRRGRAFVNLEDKIRAIGEIFVKEKPKDEVLRPIYRKAGRTLPDNTSVVIQNWKKSIQDKLDRNDPNTIRLCKQHQIIEELPGEGNKGAARQKRGRPRKTGKI